MSCVLSKPPLVVVSGRHAAISLSFQLDIVGTQTGIKRPSSQEDRRIGPPRSLSFR